MPEGSMPQCPNPECANARIVNRPNELTIGNWQLAMDALRQPVSAA
jgi:hypothetical protein